MRLTLSYVVLILLAVGRGGSRSAVADSGRGVGLCDVGSGACRNDGVHGGRNSTAAETPPRRPLSPGEVKSLIHPEGGGTIAKNAYLVGIPPSVRESLLSYAEEMGIIGRLRELTGRSPLEAGTEVYETFGSKDDDHEDDEAGEGWNWYIQRPEAQWNSNMHWISPADEEAQADYLHALAEGGFDEVLGAMGSHFGFETLSCFQLTFIGVTQCNEGFKHIDMDETDRKAFNLIIPLELVEDSPPELWVYEERPDIDDDDQAAVGIQYELDVAVAIGDGAHHSTASCDYTETGVMRLAATVYMADVNEANVDGIMKHYTQAFPPADREYLLSQRGAHWNQEGTGRLSREDDDNTSDSHDDFDLHANDGVLVDGVTIIPPDLFSSPPSVPGEVKPLLLTLSDSEILFTKQVFQMGLPPGLSEALRSYLSEIGAMEVMQQWTVGQQPLDEGETNYMTLGGGWNWSGHRPREYYSDEHWLSPADDASHQDVLHALGNGGFDSVLDCLGVWFSLSSLAVYQVSFSVISSCGDKIHWHHDLGDTGRRAFSLYVPVVLGEEGNRKAAQYVYREADDNFAALVEFNYGSALVHLDWSTYGTGECDERMRIVANICVADIDEENIEGILDNLFFDFPPADEDYFLSLKGAHWGGDGGLPSERLPPGYASETHHSPYTNRALGPFPTQSGEVKALTWSDGTKVARETYLVGVPETLTKALVDYCQEMGITDMFRQWTGSNVLPPSTDKHVEVGGQNWYIQRPPVSWNSNLHWISPADAVSHRGYLEVLADGGFDEVLEGFALDRGFETLACFQLTFIAVSHCERGFSHYDMWGTGERAFNMIIPLDLVKNSVPELYVWSDYETGQVAGVNYELGVAVAVGDEAYHATGECDYRDKGGMRLAATVYMADVAEDNVDAIIRDYTQHYPPRNADYLLSQRGAHWNREGTGRLPRRGERTQ